MSLLPSSLRRALVAGTVVLTATLAAASTAAGAPVSTGKADPGFTPRLPSKPLAPATSVWRAKVAKAPVAADSAGLVASLARQVAEKYDGVAAFSNDQYSVPFYQVDAGTPRTTVYWDDCQGQGQVPPQLYTPYFGAHFVDVPIPERALAAAGSDGVLAIWSPSTDQLWDLWQAHQYDGKWFACWGGRIDDWSTSQGFFPWYTGASASGLAVEAGTVGIAEARRGSIDHAIDIAVTDTAPTWSWPAQRSDGRTAQADGGIPLGTRFRLPASLDLDSLDLTPVGRMVAEAAQKYGFVVGDTSHGVAVAAERGAPRTDGTSEWDALLAGTPSYQVLRGFPWDRLQALPTDWGKPTG